MSTKEVLDAHAESSALQFVIHGYTEVQMNKIEAIEREIEGLDDESFAAFRDWFIEYENSQWDRQIEADAASEKLDPLIDEALAEHRAGKTKPL